MPPTRRCWQFRKVLESSGVEVTQRYEFGRKSARRVDIGCKGGEGFVELTDQKVFVNER